MMANMNLGTTAMGSNNMGTTGTMNTGSMNTSTGIGESRFNLLHMGNCNNNIIHDAHT